jgi:DNA polymerase III epsilon subunit-like protein
MGGGPPLVPCGHNVKFDVDFLYALAHKGTETWWLNFGNNDYLRLRKPLCTLAMCHYLDYIGKLNLDNYKLTTVCKALGIDLPECTAHDAMADVQATRTLFHKLKGML